MEVGRREALYVKACSGQNSKAILQHTVPPVSVNQWL